MKITLINDKLYIDGQGMVIDIAKTDCPNIIVDAPGIKYENIQIGGFVFIGEIKGDIEMHGNNMINSRESYAIKGQII